MRKRYVFRGTVQHVGFRYRAVSAARRLGLTGFVMNMPDGTVRMEAQGEEAALDAAKAELERSRYGSVQCCVTVIPEIADEASFEVRFV